MTKYLHIIFFIALFTVITHQQFRKFTPGDPDALCLDGSPSILYVDYGAQSKKFLIYFLGGGICAQQTLSGTLENCYQRSFTELGSSKLWPDTFVGEGYLSDNPNMNQFYANWTKIFFPYCDGTLHQGYKKSAISYKGKNLYFQGNHIVKQHFSWLNKTLGLYQGAEEVILTGMSAGGVATFLWANYVQNLIKTSNMKIVIDSGVFMNMENHITKNRDLETIMKTMVGFVNVQQKIPFDECVKVYASEQWKCLFLQYNFLAISPNALIVNSEYDGWAIPNILNIHCGKSLDLSGCSKSEMSIIEGYRKQFLIFLSEFLTISKNNAWTISCVGHVYMSSDLTFKTPLFRVPVGSQFSTETAMHKFDEGERVEMVDIVPWPDNIACAKL